MASGKDYGCSLNAELKELLQQGGIGVIPEPNVGKMIDAVYAAYEQRPVAKEGYKGQLKVRRLELSGLKEIAEIIDEINGPFASELQNYLHYVDRYVNGANPKKGSSPAQSKIQHKLSALDKLIETKASDEAFHPLTPAEAGLFKQSYVQIAQSVASMAFLIGLARSAMANHAKYDEMNDMLYEVTRVAGVHSMLVPYDLRKSVEKGKGNLCRVVMDGNDIDGDEAARSSRSCQLRRLAEEAYMGYASDGLSLENALGTMVRGDHNFVTEYYYALGVNISTLFNRKASDRDTNPDEKQQGFITELKAFIKQGGRPTVMELDEMSKDKGRAPSRRASIVSSYLKKALSPPLRRRSVVSQPGVDSSPTNGGGATVVSGSAAVAVQLHMTQEAVAAVLSPTPQKDAVVMEEEARKLEKIQQCKDYVENTIMQPIQTDSPESPFHLFMSLFKKRRVAESNGHENPLFERAKGYNTEVIGLLDRGSQLMGMSPEQSDEFSMRYNDLISDHQRLCGQLEQGGEFYKIFESYKPEVAKKPQGGLSQPNGVSLFSGNSCRFSGLG